MLLFSSSAIGWFSVWLVMKILFWPEKPFTVAGFGIQGIIPKNRFAIAGKISEMISKEFLSLQSLKEKAADPSSFNKLKPEIEYHVDHFLREKLKESFPMLSMFIGDKTINQLKTAFLVELENLFPVIMGSYLTNLEKDLNLQQLISEKIGNFSIEKSGLLANKSAKRLFNRLQLIGALAGLIVGILQVLFFTVLG